METILTIAVGVLGAYGAWITWRYCHDVSEMTELLSEATAKAEKQYERYHKLASTPLNAAALSVKEFPGCWEVRSLVDVDSQGGYVCGTVKTFDYSRDDPEDKEYARRCAEELVEKIKENH